MVLPSLTHGTDHIRWYRGNSASPVQGDQARQLGKSILLLLGWSAENVVRQIDLSA